MGRLDRRRAFWHEPLLHFALLGAGLFALNGWLSGTGALSSQRIDIDRGRIGQLAAGFVALHQRPPTTSELQDLVADAVKEEIYYREALAQGLDRDDVIVRRRMRQKLEFVSEDVDPVPEPTDAQLQGWLHAHAARFAVAPRYTFEQVFLDASRHGASLQSDAEAMLKRLRAADTTVAGDPLLLARDWSDIPASDVRALFGTRFAAALDALAVGAWQGPVASGFGLHLVRLARRDGGRAPALSEVRRDVRLEWMHAQREAANARFYVSLRKRYDIRVDLPAPRAGSGARTVAELQP